MDNLVTGLPALLQTGSPFTPAAIALVFGAVIGSFLNVAIYRLPIMLRRNWRREALQIIDEALDDEVIMAEVSQRMPGQPDPFNLAFPGSHCPHCGAGIKPWHNLPVISYLLLGGRCRSCAAPISIRYPLVELATALLTALVVLLLGPTLAGLFGCILTWALIALALIDLDTQLLPDDVTLPCLWLGLAVNFFEVITTFHSAFIGACLGYLTLWSVFHVFRLVTGKEGMGHGDFKMLAMLGAWLGAEALPLIILASSLAGAGVGGLMILAGRDRKQPIHFGPFLAAAGWVALVWGEALINAWLAFRPGH